MIAIATSWLPDSGYTPAAVDTALGDLFQSWSARWFDGPVSVGTITVSPMGLHLPQVTQIEASGRICTATALGRIKRALLEKLLGLSLQGCTLNETDHRLLDAFGKEAMNDLVARIDAWVEERHGNAADDQITLGICADSAEILQLYLPRGALASGIKAAAKLAAPAADLKRRNAALGGTAVAVDALLGVGTISFADLSQLAIGDVVLLDRATDSAADLRLVASGARLAAGHLGRDDGHVVLTLN